MEIEVGGHAVTEAGTEQSSDSRPAAVILESPPPKRFVHHSELPSSTGSHPMDPEFEYFRNEVAGWLTAGHEGEVALVRGGQLIGFHRSMDEARAEGRRLYPDGLFLAQQVLTEYPLVRGPQGMLIIWPMKRTPSTPPTAPSSQSGPPLPA